MFTNCSWLVHNLPISCSKIITLLKFLQLRLVHVLFSTCSHFDYYLFMTCSWFVNDFFTTCSWLVHYLFITWSQFITLLKFLDLFMTCSGLAIDLLLNHLWLVHWLIIGLFGTFHLITNIALLLLHNMFTICSGIIHNLFTWTTPFDILQFNYINCTSSFEPLSFHQLSETILLNCFS